MQSVEQTMIGETQLIIAEQEIVIGLSGNQNNFTEGSSISDSNI